MKLIKFIKRYCKVNSNSGLSTQFDYKSKRKIKEIFFFIFFIFLLWQISVTFLIHLGRKFPLGMARYLYMEEVKINPYWLWNRANFDGIYYLDIARTGYKIYSLAFFPLYQKLIKVLTPIFHGKDLIGGLFISSVSLFFALFLLYRLAELDHQERIARWTIFYLLIFPTAFYFSFVYAESLFLMLILASFYFARVKHWWLAGIFGMLASSTCLPGIFLFPALFLELCFQSNFHQKKKDLKFFLNNFLPLFFIPLGLIGYMSYLGKNFQDPSLVIHAQPYFSSEKSPMKLILLYQVFYRYIKMLITVQKITTTYLVVILEFFTGFTFFMLILSSILRRWYSYAIFMILSYITPTLTGTFSSLPRYSLIFFPGFILLAIWGEKYKWLKILYFIFSFPFFIISLILFTRGYWIS